MIIRTLEFHLYAPFSHSLKEKRMVVRSLLQKIKNKFEVAVCETGDQDLLQSIRIGISFFVSDAKIAQSAASKIISFVESATEAEVLSVTQETK